MTRTLPDFAFESDPVRALRASRRCSTQRLEIMRLTSPVEPKPWHFLLIMLVAALAASAFVVMGVDVLREGSITYTKTGFAPRTVSPSDGRFEYYYQVAFLLSLGTLFALFSLVAGLAAFLTSKLGLNYGQSAALKGFSLLLVYSLLAVGIIWVLLHAGRYWLI
jgi:hypothetical protein